MFIKEKEFVNIKITSKSQATKLSKKLNKKIIIGDIISFHWSVLKSTKNRVLSIEVGCDDCGNVHKRRIRDLSVDNPIHYCLSCGKKGVRNPQYGLSCSDEAKIGLKNWIDINGNPFTWKSSILKIKEKNPWLKVAKKNTGKKRNDDTKNKMSVSALKAFKEGRRVPCNRWGKTIIKQYNGIDYQSSYELRFLRELERLNLFDKIERGPEIQYIDYDGKERTYFSDFKIKESNIVFEIKSSYIWNKGLATNLLKKEAAEKLYDYNIIIDNKFNLLNKIINNYGG